MGTADAYSANCIESNDHGLQIFTILYCGFDIGRETACSFPAMQGAVTYNYQFMGNDIYGNFCINFMTGFSDTCFFKAPVMIRAGIAVRVHMMLHIIRLSYDRKIYPVMAILGALFLTGFLTQAAVFVYRRLLESIA